MHRILIISTNHLGNRDYNSTLKSVLYNLKLPYEIITLERDEGSINLPFTQLIESIYSSYIVFKKYKKLGKTFDILFFHGFELIFFFNKIRSKKIMSLDAPRFSLKIPPNDLYRTKTLQTKINYFIFKLFYKKKLLSINAFIPFTNWCKQELINSFFVPASKITVIPTYLNLNDWAPEYKESLNTCIFVGNDLSRKGGYFIIDTFKRYLPEYTLKIVTMDNVEIEVSKNIKILRGLSKKEILREYQQANIFLFPTFYDQFGIVLTEAMACGLPIIMRDIGGGAGLVRDSRAGNVLPYNSSEFIWAKSIRELLRNKPLLTLLSENARSYAKENFSEDINGKLLNGIFEDLCVNK